MENEEILTPGTETETPATPTEEQGKETAPATEFEIDGQKLTADQIREYMKSHKDYQALVPEFTRKSQLLSEFEKKQKEAETKEKAPANPLANNPQAQEAVKVLKDLGFITKEDADALRKELDGFKSSYETQIQERQLNEATKLLSDKYSGKNGEPKFNLDEIRNAAQTDPSKLVFDQAGNVNLELTYKMIHADFYDKMPEIKAKVVKTERGSQTQTKTPATQKKAETEEERMAQAVEFFKNAGGNE